jgi:ribosomal-protein-serine acetyltransferase
VPLPTISASTKAVPELHRRESPRRESRGVPQPDGMFAITRASVILSFLDSMEGMIDSVVRHLAIRPWRTSDAPALSAAIAESVEHLRPWMSWIATEPRSLAERESMIARWEEERRAGGDMVFGMFTGAAVVGGCGLHRRLGTDGLEIGYWVHAAHVRRGYAARATALLTSVAFSFPEIELVEIHCDRSNSASQGVPSKLGFILIGQQTKPIQAPSETGLQDVWRITRSEWMSDA